MFGLPVSVGPSTGAGSGPVLGPMGGRSAGRCGKVVSAVAGEESLTMRGRRPIALLALVAMLAALAACRDASADPPAADTDGTDVITIGLVRLPREPSAGRDLQPGARGARLPGGARLRPRAPGVRRSRRWSAGPGRLRARVRRHRPAVPQPRPGAPAGRRPSPPTTRWPCATAAAQSAAGPALRPRPENANAFVVTPGHGRRVSAWPRSATSSASTTELMLRRPARVPDPPALPGRPARTLRRATSARSCRSTLGGPPHPSGAGGGLGRRRAAVHHRPRPRREELVELNDDLGCSRPRT